MFVIQFKYVYAYIYMYVAVTRLRYQFYNRGQMLCYTLICLQTYVCMYFYKILCGIVFVGQLLLISK